MNPTSPESQTQDLAALTVLFGEFGCAHTADELRVFAVHHTVEQLLALGWIEKSAAAGRWSVCLYVAAGELKSVLTGEPSTCNIQPAPRVAA